MFVSDNCDVYVILYNAIGSDMKMIFCNWKSQKNYYTFYEKLF